MFGLTIEQWRNLVLSVNTHRKQRRLSPVECARLIQTAELEAPLGEIAKALNFRDVTTLSRIRLLAVLNPSLSSLVNWGARKGELNMSTATTLMRLNQTELIEQAFALAIEKGVTKDEALQCVQLHNRSNLNITECFKKALETRIKIERSELILGSIISEKGKEVLTIKPLDYLIKQIRLILARRYPEIIVTSLRLGPGNRFSLFLSADLGSLLREQIAPKTVEQLITSLLEGV